MKALVLCTLWLSIGLLVALGGSRPPWERVLAACFWPFFLAARYSSGASATEPDPAARLRAALAPGDPAQALVGDLSAALHRQQGRVRRLEEALATAAPPSDVDPTLAAARTRSRQLLLEAREREQHALIEAVAAVEEAATRLWLLRERGECGEVEALLQGLAARLRAGEEVEEAAGRAPGG